MGAVKMVSKKFTLPLYLAVCGAIASTSYADTFRWVDANGIVNFAEQKPRGVPAESVTRISDSRDGSQRESSPDSIADANPGIQSQPGLSQSQQELLVELEQTEADRQAQISKIRDDN